MFQKMSYVSENQVNLKGTIASEITFSHVTHEIIFYTFKLEVPRTSGNIDIIPVTIPEGLFSNELVVGQKIEVDGKLMVYYKCEAGIKKLTLVVNAKTLKFLDKDTDTSDSNLVCLSGHLHRSPVYRITPSGKEITDVRLYVNDAYGKFSIVPCIAWWRNARICRELLGGDEMKIYGRIQSREYEKMLENGTSETRTAYEVSIMKIEYISEGCC